MNYTKKVNTILQLSWDIHIIEKLRIKTREFLKKYPRCKEARKYMITSAISLVKLKNKRRQILK